jgi:hypothetical protein
MNTIPETNPNELGGGTLFYHNNNKTMMDLLRTFLVPSSYQV